MFPTEGDKKLAFCVYICYTGHRWCGFNCAPGVVKVTISLLVRNGIQNELCSNLRLVFQGKSEGVEMKSKIEELERKRANYFGGWLVQRGLINGSELDQALTAQRDSGGRLGEVLAKIGLLTNKEIINSLSKFLSVETVSLDNLSEIDMDIARAIPENVSKRFCLVGIGESEGKVVIACSDPLNVIAIDTVALRLKRQIKMVLASEKEVRHAIEVIYHGSDIAEQRLRDIVELEIGIEDERDFDKRDDGTDISEEAKVSDAPVIRFVDLLLSQAVKSRASDIHIEPQERSMSIRMRVDGALRDMVPPARKMQAAITTRIKLLSEMDIAERRLPQDGRFKIKTQSKDIDVRVSSIPTIYGEKVVMRILDSAAGDYDIDQLGFESELLEQFKNILSRPHGIVIVTGPTGSGKSTTLYSALNHLKDPEKNITTVEDPVEYRLEGINQIQVKPEIGMDFAMSLRAILRQDPDIVLIGEIRDKETVEIAMKASLTGHLVLSTFHTNDAPSAISRLAYMGVARYLLASTLNLVVAQRLVRKVCDHCKEPVKLSDEIRMQLQISPEDAENHIFYHGKGCNTCSGTGYLGRLPIFEFLVIDDVLRKNIIEGAPESTIRSIARENGYGDLLKSGVRRMIEGKTTAQEVLRMAYTENL